NRTCSAGLSVGGAGCGCVCVLRRILRSSRGRRCAHSFPTRRSSDLLSGCYTGTPGAPLLNIPGPTGLSILAVDYECTGLMESIRSEEHTSELQSRFELVCRLLLEKKRATARLEETRH